MGNIDDAVPFFGKGFNKIYPLIMVIYTLLIASNFFNRLIDYFGNLNIFKFNDDAKDMDGFDPSGVMILQKERSLLQQGHKVAEHVFPLARNFSISVDVESSSTSTVKEQNLTGPEATSTSIMEERSEGKLRSLHEGTQRYMIKNVGSKRYIALRASLNEQGSDTDSTQERVTSPKNVNDSQNITAPSLSKLASKWDSMKSGLTSLRSNIGSKRFLPLSNVQGSTLDSHSSSGSLDEIFERLKQPPSEYRDFGEQ